VEGTVNVRSLREDDVPEVLAIQDAALQASSWTTDDYAHLALRNLHGWVAAPEKSAPGLLGFLLARFAADEMEILNLAVLPAARRSRIGSMLLREALLHGEHVGCSKAFLEVRASNASAILFYQSHHFQISGRRALYYRSPPENALLLTRTIPSP
jgi:ribosomal-protein-alanine acetyltransferase